MTRATSATSGRAALLTVALAAVLVMAPPGLAHRLPGHFGQGPGGGHRVGVPGASLTFPGALTGTVPGDGGGTLSEGVVQTVSPRVLVLRELDGTTVTLAIDRRTIVLVDGAPGRLFDVRPGFVVIAVSADGTTASVLRFVRSG